MVATRSASKKVTDDVDHTPADAPKRRTSRARTAPKAQDDVKLSPRPSSRTRSHHTTSTSTTTQRETHETESDPLLDPDAPKVFPNKPSTPLIRRASLFRSFVLADYVTMLNAVCGISSILFCLNYLANGQKDDYILYSFICLPLALLFDIFDGTIARAMRSHSLWGSDLDSLSDAISFVVSPATLGFTLGLRSMWDSIVLAFFVFCGIARLARFNVVASQLTQGSKVSYYEGFPVPTSLCLVAMWIYAWYTGAILDKIWLGTINIFGKELHILSIIYILWGCCFVSASIRIPKP